MRRPFEIGDTIQIDSAAGYKGRANIAAIRHVPGNTRVGGTLSLGCDVLCADAKIRFYFLHDIARWNVAVVERALT